MLEAREAKRGTRKLIRYETDTECGICDGIGIVGEPDPDCPECEGTGQVRAVSDPPAAHIVRIEPCPECAVDACDECEGTGVVVAERLLRVRLPPSIQDGDQLRVTAEGGAGDPGTPPGDLLLELEVRPGPLDSPLVRYLALAAMLLAITLLVAYLLLA